jgi:hypothetical protein
VIITQLTASLDQEFGRAEMALPLWAGRGAHLPGNGRCYKSRDDHESPKR